jgi:hypothetical protein
MAGIARRIELFNSAYKLALEYVSQHLEMVPANTGLMLSNSIRDQIKADATNAAEITADAIRSLPPNRTGFVCGAAALSARRRGGLSVASWVAWKFQGNVQGDGPRLHAFQCAFKFCCCS